MIFSINLTAYDFVSLCYIKYHKIDRAYSELNEQMLTSMFENTIVSVHLFFESRFLSYSYFIVSYSIPFFCHRKYFNKTWGKSQLYFWKTWTLKFWRPWSNLCTVEKQRYLTSIYHPYTLLRKFFRYTTLSLFYIIILIMRSFMQLCRTQ